MRITLFLLALLIPSIMNSQDLKTHQWNDRIILVFSNDGESVLFKQQIDLLKDASKGCADRKLVMYQVTRSEVHVNYFNGTESRKWNTTTDLYKDFMKPNNSFKVILIGLDGTIKEKRQQPFTSKELFEIIDGMSMRQREMRKND